MIVFLGSLLIETVVMCKVSTSQSLIKPTSYFLRETYIRTLLPSYKTHETNFQTFFVWALLLIVHTWNFSPLRSNLLQLQCTCCIVPTTSRRPHGSPLVWACQWPSSQSLSSPQLSHNDSFSLSFGNKQKSQGARSGL